MKISTALLPAELLELSDSLSSGRFAALRQEHQRGESFGRVLALLLPPRWLAAKS